MLALLPLLSPAPAGTTSSVVTVLLLLKVVLYLAGELALLSPREDLSLDLTLPELEFLENISMVSWSPGPSLSSLTPSHLNIHHFVSLRLEVRSQLRHNFSFDK